MNRVGRAELKKSCLPRLCLDTLFDENVVFSKMLYRGKNQHRHDKSFQKMTGVSKRIKKYQSVNLPAKVKTLVNSLFSVKATVKEIPPLVNSLFSVKATVKEIPPDTVQLVSEVSLQLLESATFTAHLLQFTEDTWREVHQRLVKALFIPFNIMMLASLSRIWFCLRFHLLGIADTYTTLRDTALHTTSPAVSVVDHLEQCHRQYLRPPTLDQLSPQTIDSSVLAATERLADSRLKKDVTMAVYDTGVAIKLTAEELRARNKDFSILSQQPLPSNTAQHPMPTTTAVSGLELSGLELSEGSQSSSSADEPASTAVSGLELSGLELSEGSQSSSSADEPASTAVSGLELSEGSQSSSSADEPASTAVSGLELSEGSQSSSLADEPASTANTPQSSEKAKKKQKKKQQKRKDRKRRQAEGIAKKLRNIQSKPRHPGRQNFRQIVVKHSGREKVIIGSKVWKEKRLRKRAMRKQKAVSEATAVCSSSNTNRFQDCEVGGSVHNFQTLFQQQLDRAAAEPSQKLREKTGAEGLKGRDDIDAIFADIQ